MNYEPLTNEELDKLINQRRSWHVPAKAGLEIVELRKQVEYLKSFIFNLKTKKD